MTPQPGSPVSRKTPEKPEKPDEADKNEAGKVDEPVPKNHFTPKKKPLAKVTVQDISARDGVPFMPESPPPGRTESVSPLDLPSAANPNAGLEEDAVHLPDRR
jgi:hypothetical protein